jgi:DeoR/GlpR family transcriptional regulator of sugar metabolism
MGTGMNFHKRHEIIVDLVRENGEVSVDELAERFDASRETIRRDLGRLSDRGFVKKVHGGAVRPSLNIEGEFDKRMNENVSAKRAVASAAVKLFNPGDTMFVDTGSTTVYFAEQLAQIGGFTVATNSAIVAATLSGSEKRSRAFLLGGEFNADNRQTVGEMALSHIRSFRAHTVVLAIGAIHATAGVMDFNIEEAQVARAMIDRAERVVVLADSSKFDRTAMFAVCELGEIDVLVCEALPSENLVRAMRDAGIELVTA